MKTLRLNESTLRDMIYAGVKSYYLNENKVKPDFDEELEYEDDNTEDDGDKEESEIAGLDETIMDAVNESINKFVANYGEKPRILSEKNKKDTKKKNTKKKDKNIANKRSIVISWLKDNSVNNAEIMRKLWHPKSNEEDGARSYFYKCRDGALNDSGIPYRFSDEDINSLYRIKSNG